MNLIIDERKNIEHQIIFLLLSEVGRGIYQPGDILPSPKQLARDSVINSVKVKNCYQRLCESRIISLSETGDYMLLPEAVTKSRKQLLENFRQDFSRLYQNLVKVGCPIEQIMTVLREITGTDENA